MLVAIDQPNYIPWKGYFDMIHDVDLFVFYNDVQYTVRDWRSRNKIITPNGIQWLSVPAGSNRDRLICEVTLPDKAWQRKHFKTIIFAYSKAPFFKKYIDFFAHVYCEREWEYLFELDQYLIEHIARDLLGIKTKFVDSRDYPKTGVKHEKLLSLISVLGGWTDICLARLQRAILLMRIILSEGLNCCGRITTVIPNIHRCLRCLITKFLLLICCSMWAMTHRIIYGVGVKKAISHRILSDIYVAPIIKMGATA